jgi:mannose-6-phosphate isomerase-like protein (cupin superfamily)
VSRIPTRDANGNPNGYVLPIWHVDDGPPIEQVYMTTIAEGARKGPHLHMKRRGLFSCVRGAVKIVARGQFCSYVAFDLFPGSRPIVVPPGIPCELRNTGEGEAYVLNMPSPPWRASEPDEWPVEDWNPPCV